MSFFTTTRPSFLFRPIDPPPSSPTPPVIRRPVARPPPPLPRSRPPSPAPSAFSILSFAGEFASFAHSSDTFPPPARASEAPRPRQPPRPRAPIKRSGTYGSVRRGSGQIHRTVDEKHAAKRGRTRLRMRSEDVERGDAFHKLRDSAPMKLARILLGWRRDSGTKVVRQRVAAEGHIGGSGDGVWAVRKAGGESESEVEFEDHFSEASLDSGRGEYRGTLDAEYLERMQALIDTGDIVQINGW